MRLPAFRLLMPGTIHDESEHEAVTEVIDLMAGRKLTLDQADYLATLGDLSEAYESQLHTTLPQLAPHEFLSAHLEMIEMSGSEWGRLIGIDRSTASRLLRGERKLNTTHIRKTAELLNIEASLLL